MSWLKACPECGNTNWNDLGCMSCGLEFFPPSEAYWAASALTLSERVTRLYEDEPTEDKPEGYPAWQLVQSPPWRPPVTITHAQKECLGLIGDPEFAGYKCPELPASASPIEQEFWAAYLRTPLPELEGLVFQHPVLRYRIDFALPARKIGIELDGFRNHSSTADIAKDRKRQRELEALGWYIIRFGGAEVHRDAVACAVETARLIKLARKAGQT